MDKLFLTVLNMSLTGAFVIAAVILARVPLKKAPKIISYCLWAVVGFRLICPFTMESVFSLIPFETQQITDTRLLNENISFSATMGTMSQAIGDIANGGLSALRITTGQEPDGTQIVTKAPHHKYWLLLFSKIWFPGVLLMLLYGIISYALLKRRMRTAIRVEGNLYETDNIQSPFVLGIIKPKIYLPLSLTADERDYIILHERTHVRRYDHIVKFVAYFILCLHWFNPLAWVAFLLMGVDMEMSCDEFVLKEMGGETKHDYSRSLLSLATQKRMVGSSPLAFGEGSVKERVKNVLNFKKHPQVIIVAAVALVAMLSVGLVVNKVSNKKNFTVPYFSAGGLTLGYYIQDMDLSIWNQADTPDWDYTGPYGAFRINNEGRIDKFTVNVHAFTEGIWTMSGIEPSDWLVNNYVFQIPTYIGDILERFGERSERYDAPENSKDVLSYVRYDDKQTGIAVLVEFRKGNGQVAYVTAEGLPPVASRPTPVPPAVPLTDIVSIIVWKDNNGQSCYSLFDGNVIPSPYELSGSRVYTDIDGLNTALAEYPQDSLSMAYIKHSLDITKDEGAAITESIILPSDSYTKATGYYEFHITTLDEARDIVGEHYPGWLDITFIGEDTINYTNPPNPAEVYKFEVVVSGLVEMCAVSKERGIFFNYTNRTWLAFTGLLNGNGATQNMTLNDVRAIAQKIGTDLTMGDLRDFIGTDIGSGLYVMQYYIENSDYILLVGSGDMSTVAYAILIHATDGGQNESIDIRYYDVDKFIKNETKELVRPLPLPTDLESAISQAILDENKNGYNPGDFSTEAHTTLTVVEEGNTVTAYLMVLYQNYGYRGSSFSEPSGSHMPVAITFDKSEEGGYSMTEYWIPRDGSYYAPSIKEKFPANIYEDALDTQKYIYAHEMSCYEQAIQYGAVDASNQIALLLETICSSPARTSNPGAYIEAHSIEYRELVYYGRYTLDYCFTLFEQGGQTGLEGHIMAAVCSDILPILGETVTGGRFNTGQDWYDAQTTKK